ncbi:MAG: hypothetical protein BWY88_00027 [Synergistetes bacterium ADurb.Bin520]|nr:MAG: hypothetical protein BWY88_00027 [Synergistetes bacterium ADurb.Bin520]
MDHADAHGDGIRRGPKEVLFSVDKDAPRLGGVEPAEHVHEGALARPVLPQQGVNLPGPQVEGHIVVRPNPQEGFDYASHAHQGPLRLRHGTPPLFPRHGVLRARVPHLGGFRTESCGKTLPLAPAGSEDKGGTPGAPRVLRSKSPGENLFFRGSTLGSGSGDLRAAERGTGKRSAAAPPGKDPSRERSRLRRFPTSAPRPPRPPRTNRRRASPHPSWWFPRGPARRRSDPSRGP